MAQSDRPVRVGSLIRQENHHSSIHVDNFRGVVVRIDGDNCFIWWDRKTIGTWDGLFWRMEHVVALVNAKMPNDWSWWTRWVVEVY